LFVNVQVIATGTHLIRDRSKGEMITAVSPVSSATRAKPRIVIVGAGFGGLNAAKGLARVDAEVTIVDRHNYDLFQPLLYQVATAALSPADIAAPIRSILRGHRNLTVLLATATGIDVAARQVELTIGRLDYDQLVVATGSGHSYFGHDEWAAFAPGLKTLDDAVAIRRRILLAFEYAERTADEAERRRLLTFVVIGGGPTGAEMAGAIAELARATLAGDFRHIDPRTARIMLVEAGPRILPGFPAALSAKAERALQRLGVEVLVGRAVTRCDPEGAEIGNERIESRTLIWAAGVAASPAAGWLDAKRDRAGRILVEPDLTLPGHSEVFVIGDTARGEAIDPPLPGLAAVAKQQGAYAARVIAGRLSGRPPPPFRYRNYGNLATIGRREAVADFGWMRAWGRPAWVLWSIVHIYFLIGFRRRLLVAIEWFWSYLTYQRGARLISGEEG
jgi:NADH dehydrogenase